MADIELAHICDHTAAVNFIRAGRAAPYLDQLLEDLPSLFDTAKSCLALGASSACGPDGVSPKLFTECAPQVARLLGPLNFKAAATAVEPLAFNESTQFELFKGPGQHSDVEDSRGITCANAVSKPLNSFARRRLYFYTENYMLDTKIGGRIGGGTDIASTYSEPSRNFALLWASLFWLCSSI